jgi:1-acyl-sn-glycerol-3-phosphate acyltransferase
MPLRKIISKFFFQTLAGWKYHGVFPHHVPKYLIVVAPHTSNWDFVIGVLTRNITGLKSNFVGKKELFVFPFGYLFRWLGGHPVDRSANRNFVDEVANLYISLPQFVVAVAPEGTRKKTDRLKSGFYYIAKKADVPILPVGLDYKTKTVVVGELHKVADSFEEEQKQLLDFFATITGKFPKHDLRP